MTHLKKFFGLAVFLTVIIFGAKAGMAQPQIPPGGFVDVCSAMVYDLDNDAILFEQNPDQRIPPASLTKVLSMFLALDFIRDGHAAFDSEIPVSARAAAAGGSSMGIRTNEKIPFKKLLLGMAVSSGNDASHAIAEYVGGSAENFVKMMNTRAANLGMINSNFQNPHGLPAPEQYTTARDMLTLARAYLKAHPYALEMHNTKILEHGGYTSWNKNPLLGQYPGADGLKTGWIRASGYNMIFTATQGGRRLLAVILGAPDSTTRGAEACRLLDAGFMVCGNNAVSVAAALDTLPLDVKRIDPRKTAREAGLLKKAAPAKRFVAKKGKKAAKNSRKTLAAKSKLLRAKQAVRGKLDVYKNRREHAQRQTRAAKRS